MSTKVQKRTTEAIQTFQGASNPQYELRLSFSPDAAIAFKRLQSKLVSEPIGTVQKALALLDVVTDHVREEGTVILKDKDGSENTLNARLLIG